MADEFWFNYFNEPYGKANSYIFTRNLKTTEKEKRRNCFLHLVLVCFEKASLLKLNLSDEITCVQSGYNEFLLFRCSRLLFVSSTFSIDNFLRFKAKKMWLIFAHINDHCVSDWLLWCWSQVLQRKLFVYRKYYRVRRLNSDKFQFEFFAS